jgi:cobalt-zinc-cadmium efflux system membrane fusion protein
MAIAFHPQAAPKPSGRRLLPWAGTVLCLAFLLGHIAYDRFGHSAPEAPTQHAADSSFAKTALTGQLRTASVTLSNAKLEQANLLAEGKLAVERVRLDRVSTEVPVAGTVQANSDLQVEVRPRASGIIREVHVLRGQNVHRGQLLVTLDSPEVGTARLNLRARQRDLAIARFEADWKNQVATNVSQLIPQLRKGIDQRRAALSDDEEHADAPHVAPTVGTDSRSIERAFTDKQLGSFRGTLLQAYAEFDIASHEEQKTALLRKRSIMGEHPVLVARHTREGIQAKLEAAVEQVRYDAAQEKRVADQGVRQAEAGVIDAAQRLRILGVAENIPELLAHPEQGNDLARDEDVTVYRIHAPFDGTIVRRDAVPSQKADSSDSLFLLADLRSVWITANVPESDVAKIPGVASSSPQPPRDPAKNPSAEATKPPRDQDGTFRLTAVSYPGKQFSARILSVGAVVDNNTRTVPLLAVCENPDNLLKPNMFVRIELGSAASESALTVPDEAVVEIDSIHYVFIPSAKTADGQSFILRPVEIGPKTGAGRIIIRSGLKANETIIASGAYVLKFEYMLKNQPEEE